MKSFRKTIALLMTVLMLIPNIASVSYAANPEQEITVKTTETATSDYSITTDSVEHGKIIINESNNKSIQTKAGDTVNVDLKADDGYEVTKFTIKSAESNDILAEEYTDNNLFTFEMPNVDIVISAEFSETATDNNASINEGEDNCVVFDKYYEDIDESFVNTSDLLIETSDSSVFTKNTNVVSNYNDVYIVSCESVEEARYVYSFYVDNKAVTIN